jgi:hypothetical protein
LAESNRLLDTQSLALEAAFWGEQMTYVEISFRYQSRPGEKEMRAIDRVRDVYGIQRILFEEKASTVRVLFDASRLKEDAVAKLLRQAGIDVGEKLALA